MVDIAPVDPKTVKVPFPAVLYGGFEDGKCLGVGGLVWAHERCWLVLGFTAEGQTRPVRIVRWAKRMLRKAEQLGETEVFSWREDLPHSKKLLELIGLEFVAHETVTYWDGTTAEKEVWKWLIRLPSLPSPPSEPLPLQA
jgi:hypothetical protein